MSRHVYRWATLPVVSVAQLEQELELPVELDEPWEFLQRRFGCASKSGNVTSNVVHNFDVNGRYVYKVNEGFPDVVPSEEAFMRIMREVEAHALPLYHHVVLAIIAFSQRNAAACALHMSHITRDLEPLLSQYYSRMHNKSIARAFWLSYVQGIHAWGLTYVDAASDSEERIKYNGLSGNQLLAFQLLDAFLGIEPYLSKTDRERTMPLRQRRLCQAIETHCFRYRLHELGNGDSEAEKAIQIEFSEIVKRLRMFRAAHRRRGHAYLLQPAAERLPMTAGKGLLRPTMDESMVLLDQFMVGRLAQTV
ncbi:hypothetical protein N0V93_002241 [Gnomoniopsis smithogilvyi]|uniref:Uncharacterized protein n=1 Tax=Gnomoniopsis smithogilvyi TaxID=1191159 RepID=A0A9W8YYD8_9PEZI|nr:hypothetical protein N0V93_002241 [Gnomoniopsis smithogilvyi]